MFAVVHFLSQALIISCKMCTNACLLKTDNTQGNWLTCVVSPFSFVLLKHRFICYIKPLPRSQNQYDSDISNPNEDCGTVCSPIACLSVPGALQLYYFFFFQRSTECVKTCTATQWMALWTNILWSCLSLSDPSSTCRKNCLCLSKSTPT